MAKSTYVWLDQLSRALRPRDPDARRDPRRGARHARPLGRHRPVADRPVGALAARRSGSSGCAATPTRSPRPIRSTTTAIADDLGGEAAYAEPARPGLGARHPPGERHGAQPHGHRLALGHRAPGVVPLARPSRPIPAYTFNGPDLSPTTRGSGSVLEDHYWDDSDAAVVFKRVDRETGDDALRLPRQRRHELPVERHRPARLPRGRRPRGGHPDDPRRRPAASRSSASTPRWSSPSSTSSGCGSRSPGTAAAIPSRAEHAHAEGASSTRRCRTSSGARSSTGSPPRCPDTLLLAEAFWLLEGYFVRTLGHAPRLQQRVHAHAPRRGQRRLPAGDQGDARVRPGDPQALRQLHEQPRREDRGRAVRQGRQVLRRRDAAGDAARAADARPRPDRGLRREVRDGVPPGDAATSGPTRGWSSATSARSSRSSTGAALVRRGRRLPAVRLRDRRRRRSTRTSSPTRTGRAAQRSLVVYHNRFASTSGRIRDSARVRASRRRTARSGWSAARWPRASGCPNDAGGVRRLPRRADRARVPSARAARSGSAACAVSLDAYGDHVFWEFREVCDGVAGPVGRLAATLGGAGVPSLEDALRELQLEPVHAPLRAIFADGLSVAVMDGAATTAQLDELERGSRVPARDRDGDRRRRRPGRDRGGSPGRAERRSSGWRLARTPFRGSAARAGGRPDRPDTSCLRPWARPRDRATCWRGARHRRPPGRRRATSLAWYDELRLPVRARRRAPRHRLRRGRGMGGRRPGPGPARAAAAVRRSRGPARIAAAPPARRVAGDRGGPRRRSASTPGKASSTSTATGSATCSPGPSASTRSTRAGRAAEPARDRAPASPAAAGRAAAETCRLLAWTAMRSATWRDRGSCRRRRRTPSPEAARDAADAPAASAIAIARPRLPEQDPPQERRRRRAVGDAPTRGASR